MNKTLYNEVSKLKVLPEDEILELIEQYKAGDTNKLSTIIESNLKLIIFFVKKYSNYINNIELIDEDDLIAEGTLAVKNAVENFNPNLNIKFTYFLSIWVKKNISEAIIKIMNTIKLPVGSVKENEKLIRLIQTINQESESEIERYQLEELNIPKPQIDFYFKSKMIMESFDENENIEDDSNEETKDDLIQKIKNEMDKLTENEQKVITLYFGIDRPQPMKSIDIAKLMKISRQYVIQVKRNAISKLKLKLN
ncbi:MAG TPA: sigma-70 family RNA polymerase sigma factor [Flavobacterium sp.]|uniref:sigma-70 family RNA polymerase sigma factor n=1 Tax=unclassified Flavobacterium TaxID=196869 RepID=UPI0025C6AD13|nr:MULTISPECIES: sigma-70 family RNA polymerase sigma factor [unclassified Flavobacterium]HRE77096.1 sigma-70 family RNA polymerase sigma factor [Flavobacterium sp.]